MADRILGAWLGRICGCMLGKPIEGIRSNELIPFLKETENYPLHRYILRGDVTEETLKKYKFPFSIDCYADEVDGMPPDDDTNYTVLYQEIIEKYGRNFTSADVAKTWLNAQPKDAYCTAERVAYCNFVNGFAPPQSAVYQNAYREWIGAQIRGDYFGYINPGNPELAAEMAWRDACISHVKNGIYGEMFVAAMLSVASQTDNIKDILLAGLAQIPHTSRLYEDILSVLTGFESGVSADTCFRSIHEKYDEHTSHGWCHTIPNAMIVAAALLYGRGDYQKSICMAVQTAFDTDCNAATVGSVLGMAYGSAIIPKYWAKPINNTLHTSIFGVGTVKITDRVKMTLKHIG
jgi:ADP-ribosylglycohydrolase